MKTTNPISIHNVLFELTVVGALMVAPAGWGATIADNFNDGNDTAPTIAWERLDPISEIPGVTTPFVHWSFPGGDTYRILADASLDPGAAGPGRGLSLAPGNFTSFYVAADVVNWDTNVHQIFGVLARVGTPGPGTTTGYLFNWDNSSNPGDSTSGDMDIVRIEGESPVADLDDNTYFGNDSVHLVTGHSYRFVFMGVGGTFRGQVYDLTNTVYPIVDYGVTDPSYDPNGATHVSGPTGLIVANNASAKDGLADATFDNFLATDGDLVSGIYSFLKITTPSAGTVCLSWPFGTTSYPLNLFSSPGVGSPVVWTGPLTPTGTNGAWQVYCVSPATGMEFFKLAP
jgi:hypothetical protein